MSGKVVRAAVAAALMAALAGGASAQEGADPRALKACEDAGTFVQVADCLPDAHVAFKVLDAFDATYPPEAAPIRARCEELNDTVASVAICLTDAINTAVSLSKSLPTGATLDDPVFNAAKDASLLEALNTAETEARTVFPDKRFWGGGVYHAYK